jgi:hypothetical protein
MVEPAAAPTTGQPCVLVLGMHRSGTSATTASVAALGLATPAPSDRIAQSRWNERGNFESRALKDLNDRLLFSLGGTWSGPPELTPGWEAASSLDDWRARAARSFAKSFPSRPMVWKDPRNCITLPFWRTVIDPPLAAVFVYRDPLEVAGSLQARDGVTLTYGLALWDRYVRSACANLVGLPTLVADYAGILDQPDRWLSQLADFLRDLGTSISLPAEPDQAWMAPELHRQHASVDDRPLLARAQSELFETLGQHDGVHRAWSLPDLGPEPTWVDDVLHLRRQADSLRNQLNQAEQLSRTSKVFRITRFVGNLRG